MKLLRNTVGNLESPRLSRMKDRELKKPSLRYPEFGDSWESAQLGEYLEFKNGFNADISQYGTGRKFINVLDIMSESPICYDSIIGQVTMSEDEFKKFEVKFGDILFQRSSETREEVGQSNVYLDMNATAAFGGFVIRGAAKKSYEPLFLHYLLKTASVRKDITNRSGGSTRYNIGQESLRDVRIFLPTQPEQQKIAAFLSAVDQKIEQLARKKELLLRYKKGVMKRIFNQEIRFIDDNGDDFPNWRMVKIGDFADVSAGATPSTFKPEYWDGDIRWMNSGELNLKRVYEVENRISESGLRKSSTRLLPKHCVLIGLAGQGRTRGTVAMNMVELCTNQSIAAVHPNQKVFVEDFLFHNLDTRYDELRSLSTGEGGRGGLNLQIIRALTVPLPSISEQQKIAAFFSSLENKVNLVHQQLENTKLFKRGLLQHMFV